jgi:adenylate kinase
MVEQRLKQADCREGYVLDGYPRTINQAEFLDKIQRIDHVIDFALDEKNIIMRISGRRTCSSCQSSFHNDFKPPKKSGICDQCGGGLVQREDERPQVVKNRLMVYQKQTAPLIDYYKRKKLLVEIDASPSIKDIHAEVMRTLT